jgi:regulator of protease activity HflC (stomatin/prohibitin superfamily)
MKRFIEENRMTLVVFLLLVLFIIVYLAPRIFIFVNSGQAGVLFRRFFGGVVTTNVYGEGFHIISPWNKMFIYDMRVQQLPIEYDVLTRNGLRVKIKLSIRYHPKYETIAVLHQRIGPQYVQKIVIPVAESSVRSIVGEKTAQDLFSLRGDIIYAINNKAEIGLNLNFIALDEILIRDVVLPSSIQSAIELKEIQKERYEAYAYILKREREETIRKEIEAFGWKNYNDLISQSLNLKVLRWMGIQATRELADSKNAKVVIMGNGSQGLPVILGSDFTRDEDKASTQKGKESPVGDFKNMESMTDLDRHINKLNGTINNLWRFNNPARSNPLKSKEDNGSITPPGTKGSTSTQPSQGGSSGTLPETPGSSSSPTSPVNVPGSTPGTVNSTNTGETH